jgi:hypothetical protein
MGWGSSAKSVRWLAVMVLLAICHLSWMMGLGMNSATRLNKYASSDDGPNACRD